MDFSRRTLITASLGMLAFGRALAAPAASAAAATIEAFYATLLAVMKKGKKESFAQRFNELQPAIVKTFDLATMTRIAVGPKWASLSSDEQRKLIAAFQRYTIATYTSNFDSYSGQHFQVSPKPVANPNGVIVQTRLIRSDGKPIVLNYLMRQNGGRWQVIDVYLKGTISQLAVRRSEFAAVMSRSGAEGLVRALERKAAALQTG